MSMYESRYFTYAYIFFTVFIAIGYGAIDTGTLEEHNQARGLG